MKWALLGATLLVFAATIHVAVFDWRVGSAPDEFRVQYVPDDGFYYLCLARNAAIYGEWTFDGGVSTTTGFHPLFAYLLYAVFSTAPPATSAFVSISLFLCAATTMLTFAAVCLWGLRQKSPALLLMFGMLAWVPQFAYGSVSSMEWPFTVFFAFLYAAAFQCGAVAMGKKTLALLAAFGFLGSLARSDSGLWPLSIFAVTLTVFCFDRERYAAALRAAAAGLLGATAGLAVVLIHVAVISGSLIQSSARIKAHWAYVLGPSTTETLRLVSRVLGGQGPVAWLAIAIIVLYFFSWAQRYSGRAYSGAPAASSRPVVERILAIASTVTVAGYLLVYTRNGAVQPWYTANLVIPFVLFLAFAADRALSALEGAKRSVATLILTLCVLASGATNVYELQANFPNAPPWKHQAAMYRAGVYLSEHAPNGRVGSWNSGIIGYFQGGTVVNLDGVVNDDVYPFVVSNRLPEYIDQKGIEYLVDWRNMFNKRNRSRCGHDDDSFINRLRPVLEFTRDEFEWKNLTLYRVDSR